MAKDWTSEDTLALGSHLLFLAAKYPLLCVEPMTTVSISDSPEVTAYRVWADKGNKISLAKESSIEKALTKARWATPEKVG